MNDTANIEVIEIDPPVRPVSKGSRSKWEARLSEARARCGRWVMVTQPMTKATAAQLASDLRRSHARNPKSLRIGGVHAGERWETTFGLHPVDPIESEYHLWIRWMGPVEEFAW